MLARAIALCLLLSGCPDRDVAPTDPGATDRPAPDTDSDSDTDVDTDEDSDTDIDTDSDSAVLPDPVLTLTDVSAAAGLTVPHWDLPEAYVPRCNGSDDNAAAAAVEDFDGDGDLDVFLARFDAPGILYANRGDGTFEDVTARSGIATTGRPGAATFVDVDGDGHLDLTLAYLDRGYLGLWRNQGDGTFTDETVARGLGTPAGATTTCPMIWGLAWGDYDRDGDLDLATGTWNLAVGNEPRVHNQIYDNQGDGTFVDVTARTGVIADYKLYTYTPGWADFDGDGWLDLALASDFGSNELWRNRGDGTFEDISLSARVTDVENGMGSVIADFDGDGHLDWFVTSILEPRSEFRNYWGYTGNRLYLNDGDALFSEASEALGVRDAQWAWGADAVDLEHDGDLDLIVTNGRFAGEANAYLFEPFFDDPTRVFVREGERFEERALAVGVDHTGQGRSVVPFDADGDGDQDVLIVNFGETPILYRNDSEDLGHWLTVRVRQPGANRWGIGSTVWVTPREGDEPVRGSIDANMTFGSGSPLEAHFGLAGLADTVHEVRVVLPDGRVLTRRDVAVDQVLLVAP